MICRSDLDGRDRKFCTAANEEAARRTVRDLNAEAAPDVLYWTERWSSKTCLGLGGEK